MSLVDDRARVIAETMNRDGRSRHVFIMPEDFRSCRVVAVPEGAYPRLLQWVRREARASAGRFMPGTTAAEIGAEIERAWDGVPRGAS